MAVASHPDVTPEALGLLSRHENPRVRSNVAARPDLSAELVRHLASDESRLVRLTIFNREGLPSAVREQLKADPDPLLQAELKERAELFAVRPPESRWFVGADLDDAVFSTDHMFVNHPLVREVHGVAMMVGHPHPAADRADLARVDSVRDLPGFGAIPYVSASAFADQVDGSTVTVAACDVKIGVSAQPVELVARVLRSEQLVRANAEYMGNCTETYAHFIAAGVTQVVAFDDPRTGRCVLNVELVRDGDAAWSVGQVNTRFNGFGSDGSAVPSGVSEAVVRFVDLVNARQSV